MASSGIYADSYEDVRYCGTAGEYDEPCYFEGEVEVFFDPEANFETWECPLCHEEHEEGMDWRDRDE